MIETMKCFEKVNPSHPDKLADRIAGALIDYAYFQQENPKIAVEVLIGHGECKIIAETSVKIPYTVVEATVNRIAREKVRTDYLEVPQDPHLANNQAKEIRCGDNGIFLGMPVTDQEKKLTKIVKEIYDKVPFDGKYIIKPNGQIIMCQSHINSEEWRKLHPDWIINPLGDWTGSISVDSGATFRKGGSDLGASLTGGGLHGKDLSKPDVVLTIYAWLKAQKEQRPVELCCAIGDKIVDGKPYSEIVQIAKDYIKSIGGFEKMAEWGLLNPNLI